MSLSTITVGGQSVTLVSSPTTAVLKSLEPTMSDAVGYVPSVFTGQIGQTQTWPGADLWSMKATWPPLTQDQEDDVIAFLMQCRGMECAFQLGDPLRATPRGSVAGTPLVDNSVSNANGASSRTLGIKGFTASATGVLVRGDYLQIGYRLHRNLDTVNADGSGNALINIWPSLREQPTDSGAVVTSNTVGLWRLAKNDRNYSKDLETLTRVGFEIREWR